MAGKNTLAVPEAPLRILKTFNKGKVPFVIVGGAAIVLHGIPRSTLDIDIVVPAEPKALHRIISVIEDAGILSQDKHIFALIGKPRLLIGQWITLEEKGGREIVDIFFENEEKFRELLKRAKKIRGMKDNFYIASLDDLEKMKKESARAIDLADLVLIKERRRGR